MKRFRRPEWWPRPRRRRGYGLRYCPDAGEEVLVSRCVRCERFRDWAGNGLECCYFDYEEDLKLGLITKSHEEYMAAMREVDPEAYREMVEEQEAIDRRADDFLASRKAETDEDPEDYEEDDSDEEEDDVDEDDEDDW